MEEIINWYDSLKNKDNEWSGYNKTIIDGKITSLTIQSPKNNKEPPPIGKWKFLGEHIYENKRYWWKINFIV